MWSRTVYRDQMILFFGVYEMLQILSLGLCEISADGTERHYQRFYTNKFSGFRGNINLTVGHFNSYDFSHTLASLLLGTFWAW
jgi:hypothetical protein